MKVVIAIDSLKGSLTSMEAGNAIKEGILRVSNANIIVKPLADGGEGTVDTLIEGLGCKKIYVDVTGPLNQRVTAYYGYQEKSNTAIIEMASASGITLIKPDERNPMIATTYGVGEMIKHAAKNGCRHFIVAIGGSATNDGGIGMLQALGYEFFGIDNKAVGQGGQALEKIKSISDNNKLDLLKECSFKVACDVTNPLCGINGATYIYGPQKGVTDDIKDSLDAGMKNYAKITKSFNGTDYKNFPGAGAAGGLGFAFLSFLNAELELGIELILNAVQLEKDILDADYVITGEGKLDYQTSMGKAPIGVAKLAKKHGVKVIALTGSIGKDASKCNEAGIDAYFSIINSIISLEYAMDKKIAIKNMTETAEQVFRLISSV
ncbi:MAG: glycerate kinase [Epulopiscium sp.]|nr:glycerate kinase [Candidatus Epulonipiscium sp.]